MATERESEKIVDMARAPTHYGEAAVAASPAG
jgi:hypothetical protein